MDLNEAVFFEKIELENVKKLNQQMKEQRKIQSPLENIGIKQWYKADQINSQILQNAYI